MSDPVPPDGGDAPGVLADQREALARCHSLVDALDDLARGGSRLPDLAGLLDELDETLARFGRLTDRLPVRAPVRPALRGDLDALVASCLGLHDRIQTVVERLIQRQQAILPELRASADHPTPVGRTMPPLLLDTRG
ncbi:MAG TPA: hypothetical protein VNK43_01725 [Gemmatimonadales bacterium]|nr:hypothetical protein [Gemmatimonadales bacterium]